MRCANCRSENVELIEVIQYRKRFKINDSDRVIEKSIIQEKGKTKKYIYCNNCNEKFEFKFYNEGKIWIVGTIK